MPQSRHDSLRWRAAEVCGICCQNHPEVQIWFFKGGVLPVAAELLSSSHDTVVLKGLFAISSLVRGHPPALAAFLQDLHGLPLATAVRALFVIVCMTIDH